MDEGASGSALDRATGYLRARPLLALLILTPGIPEYLSSSSPINAVVLNPPQFAFQLLANLGLYGSGALLIHDARVRWKKGWGAVLLLGLAYGILEEGVALGTLFDPNAGPVGALGTYGHWLGVNWVWAAGILPFHAVFSIAVPLLLLGLAFPETRRRPLLSGRRTVATLAVLSVDVLVLAIVVWRVSGYWMGWSTLGLSVLSIGGLVIAARAIHVRKAAAPGRHPAPSAIAPLAVGASFFPAVILVQGVGQGAGAPAAVDFVAVLALQAAYLLYLVRRDWGSRERAGIALVLGLLLPIMALGAIAELALPLTLLADTAVILFLRRLWRTYGTAPQGRGLAPALNSRPRRA